MTNIATDTTNIYPDCYFDQDYVRVYDDNSHLYYLCHPQPAVQSYHSSGNRMRLYFQTNFMYGYNGFKLTWRELGRMIASTSIIKCILKFNNGFKFKNTISSKDYHLRSY